MTIDAESEVELARIRGTCGELGADEEMTALVLASHCHDRTLLDVMLSDGRDLRDTYDTGWQSGMRFSTLLMSRRRISLRTAVGCKPSILDSSAVQISRTSGCRGTPCPRAADAGARGAVPSESTSWLTHPVFPRFPGYSYKFRNQSIFALLVFLCTFPSQSAFDDRGTEIAFGCFRPWASPTRAMNRIAQ